MKKLCIAIALSFVLVTALVAFAACDGTSTEPTYYDITLNSGDNFSVVCSHKNAKAGDNVVLTVTAEEFFAIDSVTANGTACTLNDQGKYEFTMPAEKVTVDVKLKPTPDIDEDGKLKWKQSPSQIAVVEEGDNTIYTTQTYTLDFGTSGILNTIDSNGEMVNVEIYSLNEDVIPDDAISGAKASDVSGVYAKTADFKIDLTKIKEGTARIVVENSGRTLVKTIQVVDFDHVTPENLYTEKVVVDMSKLTGEYENLRIWITDNDYQIGSVYKETQFDDFVYSAENTTFEYEFKYTHDHEFTIAVGYEYYDEDRKMDLYKNFAIMNVVLPGAEAGFFTGIITDRDTGAYIISYTADGLTLTAELTDN